MLRHVAALLLALAVTLRLSVAWAGPSDEEVTRRIAFIQERLDRGTPAANRWFYGWFIGWTALTLTQATVALAVDDRGLRTDAAVGAAASSLGIVPLGIFPFPARYAAAELRGQPGESPEQRRRKLARAERLLKASAEAESQGRAWTTHALSGGVSVGVGLLLAFGYDRPVTGIITAVAGIGISEAKIFTQPTAAIGDWEAYVKWTGEGKGAKTKASPSPAGSPRQSPVSWSIVPFGGGAALVGAF